MAERTIPDKRFLGHEDWSDAAMHAAACDTFLADVKEEQIADKKVSCYNCRYRRWIQDGISCLAK